MAVQEPVDWRGNIETAVKHVDTDPLLGISLKGRSLVKNPEGCTVMDAIIDLATAYGAVEQGLQQLRTEIHSHPDRLRDPTGAMTQSYYVDALLTTIEGNNWAKDPTGSGIDGYLRKKAELAGSSYIRPIGLAPFLRCAFGDEFALPEE